LRVTNDEDAELKHRARNEEGTGMTCRENAKKRMLDDIQRN